MEGLKSFEPGFDFLAKTFAGLEEVLSKELTELGAKEVEIIKRGATFKGDAELMYKINYLSRTAIRILKPIGVFEAKSNDQLYQKVRKIDWTKIFNVNQTFIVNANVFYSEVDHSHFAALRVKDAIVDQFREVEGKRPWVAKDIPDIYVDVHIAHNICTISLDSSGESLHKREYKIAADKAPINEVLAAGMIKISGWDGSEDFIDPMCGSGTIPMEAAMIAMNIPSGYYRSSFAFMSWTSFDEELWKKVKSEADAAVTETECNIIASDRSETAVNITKRNLKHAGLHKDVLVFHKYFDALNTKLEGGTLIFNPPYGRRLEEKGELRDLYKGIGDVLKQNYKGFKAWLITPNIEAAKFIGLHPSEKHELYNGPIETKFLKFEMYEGSKKDKGEFGDRRREGGYDDKRREGGFGDRNRESSYGDKRRDGGFGDKNRESTYGGKRREGGFGDRNRESGYGDKKREGGFGDRNREGGYGDKRREGGFGDRNREGGYGDKRREGGFGDRNREGGYGDKRREDSYGDRKREGDSGERRSDGGGYYERKRDDNPSKRSSFGEKRFGPRPDFDKNKDSGKNEGSPIVRKPKRPRKPRD